MDKYPAEVTSLLAPFIVIQGLVSPTEKVQSVDSVGSTADLKLSNLRSRKSIECDAVIKIPSIEDPSSVLHKSLYEDRQVTIIDRKLRLSQGPLASSIATLLDKHNIKDSYLPTNKGKEFSSQIYYRIKYATNQYRLPRGAVLGASQSDSVSPQQDLQDIAGLLSPLSPFNPDSSYSNTILPLEWVQKYRDVIPSVFVDVHELRITESDTSDMQADQLVIDDINSVKKDVTGRGIRFLSVLLCEETKVESSVLETRIEKIRRCTRLPQRTGLLFISSVNTRDIGIFVESIIRLIKPWTSDFYNSQISKLKNQTSLDLNYNSSFWLARQSMKTAIFEEFCGITESSTKFMEYCYEKLIDAIRIVKLDTNPVIWNQCRVLLDLAGLHIARSYLILGDSNMAYRKFDIHIQNIRLMLPQTESYSTYSWLATQLSWFVQLLQGTPEGIIPIDRALQPVLQNKWFGNGSTPIKGFCPLPQGGYLCLDACFLVEKRRSLAQAAKQTAIDTYLSLELEAEKKFNHSKQCINMLNKCLDFYSRSKKTKFSRTESFAYFLLGEEYYKDHNYSMAINNYMVSISVYKDERWLRIISVIIFRLFQCSVKIRDYQDAQVYYLRLAVLPEKFITPLKVLIENEKFVFDQEESEEQLFFKEDVFDSYVVIKSQSLLLNSKLEFQVVLNTKVNSLIDHAIVEDITIRFNDSFREIRVKHDTNADSKVFNIFDSDNKVQSCLTFTTNMVFGGDQKTKVLQFSICPGKIGKFRIESIHATVKTLEFDFRNSLNFSKPSRRSLARWYQRANDKLNKAYEGILMNVKEPSFAFEVTPRQPKVEIKFDYAEFAYSGQVFPIKIHVHNKDVESYKLQYEMNALVGDEDMTTEWKERTQNDEFNVGVVNENFALIHLPLITDLPTIVDIQSEQAGVISNHRQKVKVTFKFKYLMKNGDDTTVETMKVVEIPILEIFKLQFTINPSLSSVIPSIFDVNETSVIPVHDRVWKCAALVRNVSFLPISLKHFKFEIKCLSSNAKAELIESKSLPDELELTENDSEFTKLPFWFRSYCETGFLKRSIQVEIVLSFNYEDHNTNLEFSPLQLVHQYQTVIWKGSLPHLDPRMLVDIKEMDSVIEVDYILENPTSKIFQFSSSLATSECFVNLNYKNQQAFSVLPFVKEIFKFRYKVVDEFKNKKLLRLPEFKVYDLHYKVYMNQLVVTDKIDHSKEGMFYVNKNYLLN
ncbi:hypothetical protein FOA43_003701 [Brettanomyces nanus]|uniref:Uncharacterized protein n=1 Tax=Eeniella nana TaxID=13502 RepID=A0A875S7R7_EENNA|nr:uncharacterized protein FOA43_003701 [Brettanomyces nanus]QPG76315.1 hypothetical protein FOA43_003701 [Brettanomyces nanus]